jgi:riboflavin kinase/FMN adenylyltransferase
MNAPPVAITIGNFDGVHVGHVQLVRVARAAVGESGRVIVLSFDPHPMKILHGVAPGRLTSMRERSARLRDAGADQVVALNPTPQFLNQEPEEFLTSIIDPYAPNVIVEGPDFRFGHRRSGDVQTLRELEARHAYRTIVIDPVEMALTDHSVVRASSTAIRWMLERGRVRDAAILLGRPFELVGPVVAGDRRGRRIGVPTANLDHDDHLLPGDSIYAGAARREDGDRWYPAAISVGTKPTFGEHPRVCEAHLVGYDGPLDDYGWTMRLRVNDWLRDQVRYPDVDQLVDQLSRDIDQARARGPVVQ